MRRVRARQTVQTIESFVVPSFKLHELRHWVIAFTPALILEAAAPEKRDNRKQNKQTHDCEKWPPLRYIAIPGNRILRWHSPFGFDAQIVSSGGNPGQKRIVGLAAFGPV